MDNELEELKNTGTIEENNNSDNAKADSKTEEGGWGYVVCVGMIVCFIVGIGPVNSFGLIYKDFISETHASAKSLTTSHGTFAMMVAVGGIILNIISKTKLSLAKGKYIGATTFCIGSFMTVFITDINQLPFTFGIIQGIGFGSLVPMFYSTINHYFVKKRTTVMSTCKATQAMILIWYPQIMKNIIMFYGFRGTLLIISGISLHMIPCVAVVRSFDNKQRNKAANDIESHKNNDGRVELLKHENNYRPSNRKLSKIRKTRYVLEEILCLKVLRDPIYINICLGQCLVNFSDVTYFILLPMLMYQYGYRLEDAAMCLSITVGADVAGRFTLAIISNFIPLNTRLIIYISTLFTMIMRIVLLHVRQFYWVVIVNAILGVLRACPRVVNSLVIANHVAQQDFLGAYALFLLTEGLVNMILSPIIGQLKDMYDDYIPAFYGLAACCIPCLILWPIEYIWRKQNKPSQRRTSSAANSDNEEK